MGSHNRDIDSDGAMSNLVSVKLRMQVSAIAVQTCMLAGLVGWKVAKFQHHDIDMVRDLGYGHYLATHLGTYILDIPSRGELQWGMGLRPR